MLAWTTTPGAPGGLTLREVPDPVPLHHELVVRVEAFAPNPGDLAMAPTLPAGSVPGWDGSGVVLAAAADGQGPGVGERVLFLGLAGGWAQHRTVPHTMTAAAPDDVAWERLATLPVPATSALRALRRLGSVLGRRVLVVGATSAVGRMAVQLAARSGAEVVAVARDEQQHEALRGLGARETHASLAGVGARVHGAIDIVGGHHLVDAYALLEPGGTVIALGHAAGADEHFPYGAFVADPTTADRSITSFFLGTEPGLAVEMGYLAADRTLDVGAIDLRPWAELPSWIEAADRRPAGRVVFRVDHTDRP
ncbi:zinc-binding dehydrogenase [Auraticoccus monumenti]|uniref:NADPH:quinone reductase n=1 Tax=Auraticoccus monumenti TaxID=675864 RepID=A0A1G6WPE0_9ACTN|nr:zinc-binding dehydrogenase [Auraticoccus monumenti]SDD67654.1 NADPH:quinone reductase [Auraticoccus monumenti]